MTTKPMLEMTCNGASISPWGRSASTRSSGTKTSSKSTSWLDVPRMPSVSQCSTIAHAVAGERHRHVQHAQAALRVVVHEHRRQHGADRRLADERLAPADAVAALDLDGGAPGVGVVAAAGGDDDDAVLGDAAQRGLRARQVAAVAPRGERGDVLVHRRGEGGRAAVLGQLALDLRRPR